MMKGLFLLLILIIMWNCERAPEKKGNETKIDYDSLKAAEYGADEYGMKTYVFAFLKKGSAKVADQNKSAELQRAHLKNINRMADEGKLVLAGPFMGESEREYRGFYIFNVETVEEAKKLTETDPLIQSGSLEMELIRWYGTAALMEINDLAKAIAKKSFASE